MTKPFDCDGIQRDTLDHDAIQEIVWRAQARRSHEWRDAWSRTLRAVRLNCGAALIALGHRLAGLGAVQPARVRRPKAIA